MQQKLAFVSASHSLKKFSLRICFDMLDLKKKLFDILKF